MESIAHIRLPVPTTTIQFYVRNTATRVEKKQLIATVEARDTEGVALEPDHFSWTFSKATNSPYCYLPTMEPQGTYLLKPLLLDRSVHELIVRLTPWGKSDVDVPDVIASLHYVCSPNRSANSTASAISVAGVAEMEAVA
ncbi:hypothetical protein [Kocuria sp. SM24M-10]|uniref:hypothetical protein n=1 Tax=Kocuria sp. SM24M-10 TaxID=1660349 RepID=UPI00064AEF9D|nr:hypothetical protein [Kocuria sp. SM24M-10]KLU10378.1 hypothetical protein ABL57_06770 [Kocuria sp. SM24M-10]